MTKTKRSSLISTEKSTIRYSESFKLKVVSEIEEKGLSIAEVQRKYDIRGGTTIQGWLKRFGKNHLLGKVIRIETMDEKDRIKALEEELKQYKAALAEATLENKCLTTLVKLAKSELNIDLKKNFGTHVSSNSVLKKE